MLNPVLWTLDNETDPRAFERLCVDVLFRNGYRNIVPVGGMHDRGRDAEAANTHQGADTRGQIIFFQFSLQKNWKQKLRDELRKVAAEGHQIDRFVFVTTQEVSGRDRDRLKVEVREHYGWVLQILSREWLRLQLEEAHPDLAARHLGVRLPAPQHIFASTFKFAKPSGANAEAAWDAFTRGDFDRAGVELRAYVRESPGIQPAWEALAWAEYQQFRYYEAVVSINRALDLNPGSRQAMSMRACILAEYGIRTGDQRSVREATEVFTELLCGDPENDWVLHYNLGNTLSALSHTAEAIEHYRRAIELEPADPRIWKNLGSAYHNIGEHGLEMECFDQALALDPKHVIALVSKGVSTLIDFGRAEEAIQLMERALEIDPDLVVTWPHTWYWLAEAYRSAGTLTDALHWLDQGLRHLPGNESLRRLRSQVFSQGGRADPVWRVRALSHFQAVLADTPLDYGARSEAILLLQAEGRDDEAWEVAEEAFAVLDLSVTARLREVGFALEEAVTALAYLPEYVAYRRISPVRSHWDLENSFDWTDEVPPEHSGFDDTLFVAAAVPFGLAYSALSTASSDGVLEAKLAVELPALHKRMLNAVPWAARSFGGWIMSDQAVDTISHRLSVIIMFVPLVVLREVSRQHGYINGILQVPAEQTEQFLDSCDFGKLAGDAIERTLHEVNLVTQLFRIDLDGT